MFARNNPIPEGDSPLLCYVTDRHGLPIASSANSIEALIQKIAEVAAAGVDWVQIREKDLTERELASLTRKSLRIAERSSAERPFTTRMLVNDRLDVAIAERAGGVHLGERSLSAEDAKHLTRLRLTSSEGFLTGVSCHSLESARDAARSGADYIFFGPVFTTPSKEDFGPPQGTNLLEQVCRAVSIPVLAIGGVTLDNAKSCIVAGAAGIAAIRLFQDAIDPIRIIQRLHGLVRGYRRRRLPAGQIRG
jgi:thiamine-phosphate pyrophosphorylase